MTESPTQILIHKLRRMGQLNKAMITVLLTTKAISEQQAQELLKELENKNGLSS